MPEQRSLIDHTQPRAVVRITELEPRAQGFMMVASGPFDFDLCSRNAYLESKGIKPPRFTKTGTTIVGLIYKVWRNSQ